MLYMVKVVGGCPGLAGIWQEGTWVWLDDIPRQGQKVAWGDGWTNIDFLALLLLSPLSSHHPPPPSPPSSAHPQLQQAGGAESAISLPA